MSNQNFPKKNDRRKILKTSIAASGVLAVAQTDWAKPVVNSIILPAHAQTSSPQPFLLIAELAIATPALSTLVSVLTPGQVDALSGPGPLTVFAPTNDAFVAIQATIDTLTPTEIEAIVDYHVLASDQPFSAIPATTGTPATQIGDAITASNGTIYLIDQVLLPA